MYIGSKLAELPETSQPDGLLIFPEDSPEIPGHGRRQAVEVFEAHAGRRIWTGHASKRFNELRQGPLLSACSQPHGERKRRNEYAETG